MHAAPERQQGLCHARSHCGPAPAARTSAASSARFLPLLTPTPSMAVPLLDMIALTSAKSTFTRPGMVMMSEMPCTPCAGQGAGAAGRGAVRTLQPP